MRWLVLIVVGCHSTPHTADPDAAIGSGDAPADAPASNLLSLACAATAAAYDPAPCPAPSGADGEVTFCYRPQWPGVTSVAVLGGFGRGDDWTAPFVTLADRGNGTFTATAALADGDYPYVFRVKGSADGLVPPGGMYMIDQANPTFVPAPALSPYKRSNSQVHVPQVAAPVRHLRGSVVVGGVAQPCFAIHVDVGELRKPGGGVLSEHGSANIVESAADGTFDLPIADGEVLLNVKYPFGLSTDYPDPLATPAIGNARTALTLAGADATLDPVDVGYDATAYAAMSPIGGSATLPVTFAFDHVAGTTQSAVAVIATNIAGNDPAFISTYSAATTLDWDGTFGNGMQAKLGTMYWWGTWQKRTPATTTWTSESLLFPITFH